MPNSKWLEAYSDEPVISTYNQIQAVLARISLPEKGLLKHYQLSLQMNWTGPGYSVTSHTFAPDVDRDGKLAPFSGHWNLPALPLSERQLMNFLMAHVRSSFMHEFEEHFMVDGKKVLEPHGEEMPQRPWEMGPLP